MKIRKGQTSIEFLIVFAISLLILGMVAWLIYEQITTINIQKENAEVQKLLLDISNTAKNVYIQGEGASKTLLLSFPPSYNSTGSGIINNTLLLRFRETTLAENMEFPISGILPASKGMHEISFISRGNSVYIGIALYKPNVYLISSVLSPNSAKTINLTLTNLINESITINGTIYWPHTNALLSVSELNFNVPSYESKTVIVTASSTSVTGSYLGYVNFNATYSSITDNQTIDIYTEVQ